MEQGGIFLSKFHKSVAILLILFCIYGATAAQAGGLPWASWFTKNTFSGTVTDVHERFSEVCRAKYLNGRNTSRRPIPLAPRVEFLGKDHFRFYSGEPDKPINCGSMRFAISGTCENMLRLTSMTVSIRPHNLLDADYLRSCDQLMQLSVLSLFDELSAPERTSLLICMLYDLRPFSDQSAELRARTRSVNTVVSGQRLELQWSILSNGAMSLVAALPGAADAAQIETAARNDLRNLMIKRSSSACCTVINCLEELKKQLHSPSWDWRELGALISQIDTVLTLLGEPQATLLEYGATRDYALQLSDQRNHMIDICGAIRTSIHDRDDVSLKSQLDEAMVWAKQARALLRTLSEQ